MKVLVADDDPVARKLLDVRLQGWGYQPVVAADGREAWTILQQPDAPCLALLDWMMPHLSGPEVCSLARTAAEDTPRYLILLTARGGGDHVAEGLGAGADDYLSKPFDHRELQARLAVGARVIALEKDRRAHIAQLEAALDHVKQLHGLLPLCSYCRRVRDREDYWQRLEAYIDRHTGVKFSHGICPECVQEQFGEVVAVPGGWHPAAGGV